MWDEHKQLIIGIVITAVVTGVITYVVSTFNKGVEAADKEMIESVVQEMLVTDTGVTHAAALASINTSLTSISTKVEGIEGDIDNIRDSMLILTRPPQ